MKVSKKYLILTIIICVLAVAINAYIIMHSCLNAAQSTQASNEVVEVAEEAVSFNREMYEKLSAHGFRIFDTSQDRDQVIKEILDIISSC